MSDTNAYPAPKCVDELLDLVAYIERAKTELGDARSDKDASDHIALSKGMLNAVASDTEQLTDGVLDAAEELDKLARREMDSALATKVHDLTSRIYEAANFHDIATQRITKVVGVLSQIEVKVDSIRRALGEDFGDVPQVSSTNEDTRPDADLLNGPQLPGQAASQEDIDALLLSREP